METEYREQFIKFGLKVQYYRKLRNMTQEAFADEIGKSWSFVAKIESPTRAFGVSMETLFKIAEVLQVPVSKRDLCLTVRFDSDRIRVSP